MSAAEGAPIRIQRASGERPLYVLVVLAALAIWALLVVSVLGAAYAAVLGLIFFVGHVAFIAHLRGNAVRLGPEQLPDLYARVVDLSERIGLKRVPSAYVVQAGGSLNALATRFLRSNVIVLFSDLLEACGDNEEARDFIVAHELGHLHAGHLRWRWLFLPGLLVPFLGTAWSRACEYTCDRYGMAASRNSDRALDGLCVLSAGGVHGPRVNRAALVAQRSDLNTGLMRIGVWLSTHPPIANRLAALDPTLGPAVAARGATLRALMILLIVVGLPAAGAGAAAWKFWPRIQSALAQQRRAAAGPTATGDAQRAEAGRGIRSLSAATEDFRTRFGTLPAQREQLYRYWQQIHPTEHEPADPWTLGRYVYQQDGENYVLLSTGPDGIRSNDDLYYASSEQR